MNEIKDKVQQEALTRWELAGRRGLLAMGTGTGKSRIALLELERLHTLYGSDSRILLAVPTVLLRDKNWPAEAKVWGLESIYNESVEGVCWTSMAKVPQGHYHLVILDEAHQITPERAKFLENITYDEIMALTATEPTEDEKTEILDKIAPTVFVYSLDDGISDGIAADFKIHIIEVPLDDEVKYVKAGTKKKPFLTTETKQYTHISWSIIRMMMSKIPNKNELLKFAFLRRARFIYNLKTKTELAKKVMEKILLTGRTLVYAGSIDQANEIGGVNTYHSKRDDTAFCAFKEEKISYLVAVDALNEGVNLPDIDQELLVQVKAKDRILKQRIGRAVRFRPGHVADIYIIVVQGTVDENWLSSALEGIDKLKIDYISYRNFL